MSSRGERETSLIDMILTSDDSFSYAADEWAVVQDALTLTAPTWLRAELEDSATSYLTYVALGPSSDRTQRLQSAAAVAQKRAVDLRNQMGLDDLAGALESRAALLAGQVVWMDGQGARSPARARLIEWTVLAWHCAAVKPMPGRRLASDEDSGRLLDFVWSATRPVLIGGDIFSDGSPGRDSMRQELAKIRRNGFRWWRFDLDERFGLSG